MTEEELRELLADSPTLYHMATRGSWSNIQKWGLLSTSALLDLFKLAGAARATIEGARRSSSMPLRRRGLGRAMVRDQLPMDDKGLLRCLGEGLSPEDWYRALNSKVFFWVSRGRLLRLLNAGTYRMEEHDVLEMDAMSLVADYRPRVWLCPMNSGCTKPFPHPRDANTFLRIDDYPYSEWKLKRRGREPVVELAVDYAVPDVTKFVTRVVRMKASEERRVLFQA